MTEFNHYIELRNKGFSPKQVYLAAKVDNFNPKLYLRMLRAVFGLSLPEARKTIKDGEEEEFEQLYRYFKDLKDEKNLSPLEAYGYMKAQHLKNLVSIRLLELVFDLSLSDIKEVLIKGNYDSVDDYYSRLLSSIEKVDLE